MAVINQYYCGNEQLFRDYLSGNLPIEEIDAIEQHLDECESCEQIFRTAESEPDAFINHLHGAETEPDSLPPEIAQAIDRIKRFPNEPPSHGNTNPPPTGN